MRRSAEVPDTPDAPTVAAGAPNAPHRAARGADSSRRREPRADAVRNRAALVDAARAVFREQGLAAQVEDVAARAGLGVGTLYRNFPTKEALLEVMVRERHRQVLDQARGALAAPEPWEGFSTFVWRLAEMEAEDRTIADVLLAAQERVDATPFYAELLEVVTALVTRAQAAGRLRADVTAEDALIAVCTLGKVQQQRRRGAADDGAWRRLVRVILDGMRDPAAPPRS